MRHAKTNPGSALLRFGALLLGVLLLASAPLALLTAYAAAQPEAYGETYYAALPAKYDRLHAVQGEKLVVIGGSSVAFGLDSKIAEQELGLPVVNFGLYAAFGLKCMLDLSLDALHEGDIVVLAPELSSQMFSDYVGSEYLLQGCEGRSDMISALGSSYWKGLLAKLPDHLQTKRDMAKNGSPTPNGVYARSSFDGYGDIVYDRPENIMDGMVSETNLPEISAGLVSNSFAEMVNTYVAGARLRGAKVYFSFCPVNQKAVDMAPDVDIPGFVAALEQKLHCPVIASLEDHILDAGYFYDSNFHMNNAGSVCNTVLLVNDIKRVRGDMSTTQTAIPKPPAGAAGADVLRSGELDGFSYDITAKGAVITGLNASGLAAGELNVPAEIENVSVYKIASGAFRNSAAAKISLPDCVTVLGAELFENAAVTAVILNASVLPEVGDGLADGAAAGLTIYVPAEAYGDYVTDYFWSRYSGILARQS